MGTPGPAAKPPIPSHRTSVRGNRPCIIPGHALIITRSGSRRSRVNEDILTRLQSALLPSTWLRAWCGQTRWPNMYRRTDPRFRRTLNEISQTFESANESAQGTLFTISHHYVNPCLNSIYATCFQPCVEHCFPPRDQRARRNRISRGRAELNFDFYDDWEDDETDGLLGLGDEEYDGLLSGVENYGTTTQPGRQRAMSYGARRDAKGRRKSGILDAGSDTVGVPGSSYFGFFGKLTGKIGGGKVLRYKPSAANLQEHPTEARKSLIAPEGEPLVEEDGEREGRKHRRQHGRTRSGTAGSGETSDSFSSRGDLFPSEDEDDATELDDEFAMVLERRVPTAGLTMTAVEGHGRKSGRARDLESPRARCRVGARDGRRDSRVRKAANRLPGRK